ncbi:hypothetical protein [Mycobacterium montefiorense]|uniref:Uncharacterized protein n=1 Tax=Mycobacterium montefiorense TaxID=154654 RepID=A0AA37PKQ6_9MYCO|nr:hypothetical protein [Mycobacterium montefiorense]GBG39170.1 hypothetical protein MmonteBS_35420 [Mycobacterium montefiorense]GKU37357.1 hypothetical protein NJB14191_47030 [Mycobacterium montefiorense]GKU42005.1 hypothetical protein NJB14192_39880 [Mycobacterium montefiorense]GKU45533.1 hypothetical protein NJB14194_21540 [Mycobacterium montefiorense]GKU53505.1 hypothetical protein NJB14195_47460 [Mycobacterium montefiorense]
MTTEGPARNRVSPLGEIVAVSGRGAWMGNRGRLHQGRGQRDVFRNHQHKTWITCVLSFRGRRVAQWEPNRYTPLFFLDEAVALAAGHRPCGECRHRAYQTYRSLWSETHYGTDVYATHMDAQLHGERIDGAGHRAPWNGLPDGVFVATDFGAAVVVSDHLTVWDRDNSYRRKLPRPRAGAATVLTPPSTVRILRAGYPVHIDDCAR